MYTVIILLQFLVALFRRPPEDMSKHIWRFGLLRSYTTSILYPRIESRVLSHGASELGLEQARVGGQPLDIGSGS
ncbi:hypothetical protein M8818_007134 [Zalaria obscura]|uniref:Uncharacterized protein n=1 Tax=Zalaria obscura TaxID=2024903 RepID=A0ACC3S441_9PEZI